MTSVGNEVGAEIVCGPSLKAALDRDWDQVGQREEALDLVLQVLQTVESWVQTLEQEERGQAKPALETAKQVKEQDVQLDEQGKAGLISEQRKTLNVSPCVTRSYTEGLCHQHMQFPPIKQQENWS